MAALRTKWTAFLDQQHRYPTGLIGRLIGERMLRQHAPETTWSVDQLQGQPTDRVLACIILCIQLSTHCSA